MMFVDFEYHKLVNNITGWKEGNVLFNDTLNTFYFQL